MYEIDLDTIRFSTGKKHRFPMEIAEVLDFDETIVLRLSGGHLSGAQNIFGLDYRGNMLWKMPQPRSFVPQSPYVSLTRRGSFVEALNWDGHLVTLHAKLGDIVSEEFFSGGSSAGRRSPSPRAWL